MSEDLAKSSEFIKALLPREWPKEFILQQCLGNKR